MKIFQNQTKLLFNFSTEQLDVDLAGYTVQLYIIKPSGAVTVIPDTDIVIELPSTVKFSELTEQTLNEVGRYKGYLSVTETATGKELPSNTFSFMVYKRGT